MTVVYIITKLELGGAQKICLALFRALRKEGIQTILVAGPDGLLVPTVSQDEDVVLLSSMQREVSVFSIMQEIRNFCALFILLWQLKKKHPSLVVHTHSTKAGIVGRWAAFFARVPVRIHTIHGYGFHEEQSWGLWMMGYVLELVTSWITTHYVCVSDRDLSSGEKLFPRFERRASYIPVIATGTTQQHEQFIPAYHVPRFPQFIFGTISCFKPQKNLFDLIKAFSYVHICNPQARLEIIGDGVQRPQLEALITAHRLTGVVTLHGWQEEVGPFLQRWDAFVLSSLWEGLPCALVEARVHGLPVLAYRVGGIEQVICDGQNGFLYPPHAWIDLAQGMLHLSRSSPTCARMRAYKDDLESFTLPFVVQRHKELYGRFFP